MRIPPSVVALWPGLARLVIGGRWSGLLFACAFAVLLDALLLLTLVWTELVSSAALAGGWAIAVGIWLGSATLVWWLPRSAGGGTFKLEEELFAAALDCYLRREWDESEQRLQSLLQRNAGDVEAMLLLATLLRRRGRSSEAEDWLTRLRQAPNAPKWQHEIEREEQLLATQA